MAKLTLPISADLLAGLGRLNEIFIKELKLATMDSFAASVGRLCAMYYPWWYEAAHVAISRSPFIYALGLEDGVNPCRPYDYPLNMILSCAAAMEHQRWEPE